MGRPAAEPWEPRVPGEVLPPPVVDLEVLPTVGISLSVPLEPYATTVEEQADAD